MARTPTLVFVRHGETDWNAEQRLQGQRDTPLNSRGRDQARRNGLALRERLPQATGFVFLSSPLVRARETMEILRRAAGLEASAYCIDPGLIEITFGEWEGFTFAELAARGDPGVGARARDKWGFVPPGGESYAMLAERVCRWLDALATDTVAVSHGAVGRIVSGRYLGVPAADVPSLAMPQDRLLVVSDGRAEWV